MNIFTRKKKLLEANRLLCLWNRDHLRSLTWLREDRRKLEDEIVKLQIMIMREHSGIKEPYRVILIDERKGVGKNVETR